LASLTEDEARKLLAARLATYIKRPNITLRVQSYRSKRIYIDGDVKSPGLQAINDIPMTLIEALNRAGGLLPTADQSQIKVSRGGMTYQINLPQLVERGVNPASVMLVNGDVVRVLSRDESKVFISGEVNTPKSLPMHNGRLTLNEALGESGGINPLSGDASQVYVVRKSATEPVVYRLDAQAPGALALAEGFELSPKDVVFVAATPLTNWHRTISQILPGALSSAVGAVGTKP
jgi:polysaccharide export outer membrane protein